MKKTVIVLLAVLAMAVSANAGTELVAYWAQNSNDLPGGGFGFLSTAFPQASDEGAGSLTVGGGLLASTSENTNGDVVYDWVQSFSGSTLNAQAGYASGGSISIQGGTDNGNNGSYIQFAFSMDNYESLGISYATRGTSTGFSTQTWEWSTDGVNFSAIGTITGRNVTIWSTQTLTTSALDDAATAYLRVIFDGATGQTGNNRLDNIAFEATVIPEPATMVLLGLGSLVLARRRK